ncbi:Dabb family protein [Salinactinospora qingdaonensis]|uniref:Stress-response A/B barrel domain-containing protein n=1 Tax=Salinactinospora qingdaonensis TaxID=702744 RepID=A0ABP7GA58_9ACTN
MGIRHIALFRWATGTTSEQVEAVEAALSRLPELIPQLKNYSFGADVGIGGDTYDFAVVADVASEADYLSYRDHPEHQAALAVIRPLLADRASVQFNIAGP